MSNTYFSLVGNQISAVINPLFLLLEAVQIDKFVFLYTAHTSDKAEKIKRIFQNDSKYKDKFELIQISDSLETVGSSEPAQVVYERYKKKQDETIFFNLAGGMNFQIAACFSSDTIKIHHLVYPALNGFYYFNIENGKLIDKLIKKEPVFPFNVEKVLDLQNINYSYHDESNESLHTIIENKKWDDILPDDYIEKITINNIKFDYVWNNGREICFLLYLRIDRNGSKGKEKILDELRRIIDIANDRKIFGDLYHRNIYVISSNFEPHHKERLKNHHKITAIYKYDDKNLKSKLNTIFRYKIVSIDETNTTKQGALLTPQPQIILTPNSNTTLKSILFVVMGPNILPTLISVFSHRAEHVCILYTKGNEKIEKYLEAFKSKALSGNNSIPNLKKLTFLPISFMGIEILGMETPEEKDIMVNITPGTKEQSAFLSLWAGKYTSAHQYSLDTNKQGLIKWPQNDNFIDLSGPDPALVLNFKGEKLCGDITAINDLKKEKEIFSSIKQFLKKMDSENKSFKEFPVSTFQDDTYIEVSDASLKYNCNNKNVTINFNDGRKTEWSHIGDEWFEKFIGYLVWQCGADDVNARIRVQWSKQTQYNFVKMRKKKGNGETQVFRDDIDVLARFKSNYFLISCKATRKPSNNETNTQNKRSVKDTINEARAHASILDRYAVPLICYLKYGGEPVQNNGVYIFGYKTFLDNEKLKHILELAVKDKRTTQK